jgi:DNA-binding NtrC family response regulator
MPYPLQVRLLRVLQERIVNPLGSTKAIGVDIAIICATHRDLREMIAQNRFREDLYYRLNGLVVRLPPLRDRTDLAVVVQKMLQRETLSGPGRRPLSVAPDVMALFERCGWPGNFRQLANLLRTAAAMVDEDGEIRREHLPDDFFDDVRREPTPAANGHDVASLAAEPAPLAAAAARQPPAMRGCRTWPRPRSRPRSPVTAATYRPRRARSRVAQHHLPEDAGRRPGRDGARNALTPPRVSHRCVMLQHPVSRFNTCNAHRAHPSVSPDGFRKSFVGIS